MRRVLSLCLLLAFASVACGSSSPTGSSSTNPTPGISLGASGTSSTRPTAPTGSVPATASGRATPPPATGGATPPPGAISTDDAVRVRINENVPWGDSCPNFTRGQQCEIPFEGNYVLLTQASGFLVFEAYENGSKKAAKSLRAKVDHGAGPFKTRMPYTVGPTAKTVTFQAILVGADGRELDRSREYTFPVPGA